MPSQLRASTLALVAQLFFIAAGVYLGNLGDDWREARSHREAARAALQNFRTEIARNYKGLARVYTSHVALRAGFDTLMRRPAPPKTISEMFRIVHWNGLNPASFRRAAWQLALGNQSLTYIEPALAFAIADVYEDQAALEQYGDVTLRAVVNPAAMQVENPRPLGMTIYAYLVDAAQFGEPQLLAKYAALLPRVDSAIARLGR